MPRSALPGRTHRTSLVDAPATTHPVPSAPGLYHAEVLARGERWFGVPVEQHPEELEPVLLGFTHGPAILETLRRQNAA